MNIPPIAIPVKPAALTEPPITYVPILGVKFAEREALRHLPPDVNQKIYPLLTVRKIRRQTKRIDEKTGLEKISPPPTLEQHVKDQSDILSGIVRIQTGFFDNGITKAMLDVEMLDHQQKKSTLALFRKELSGYAATLVPVLSVRSSDAHKTEVRRWNREYASGGALRLRPSEDGFPAAGQLVKLARECGLQPAQVDLIVDLGGVTQREVCDYVAGAIRELPSYLSAPWRTIALGSGAFPASITRRDFDILHDLVRWDLVTYKRIIYALPPASRRPIFADYGIFYHKFADGGTRPEPNLRYTTEHEWRLIRREIEPGMQVICARIAGEPYFRGDQFSKGEEWIAKCSRGDESEGDPKRWLQAGLQQHIAFVARQMDSRPFIA
jgi:hypothetical protein